jgi:hypothetical protein
MDDRVLTDLGSDERKLLACSICASWPRRKSNHHGELGGACGLWTRPQAAVRALGKLAGRGLITEGGDDPFIGSPVAYRLVQPLPARGAEPHSTEAAERHAKR